MYYNSWYILGTYTILVDVITIYMFELIIFKLLNLSNFFLDTENQSIHIIMS